MVKGGSQQQRRPLGGQRLRDDAWATLFTSQNVVISAMQAAAEAGIAAIGSSSLAGQRLTRMRDFYAFMLEEIPALLECWRQRPR